MFSPGNRVPWLTICSQLLSNFTSKAPKAPASGLRSHKEPRRSSWSWANVNVSQVGLPSGNLGGWIKTPPKNDGVSSSVGMMKIIPNSYGKSFKIPWFQSPPSHYSIVTIVLVFLVNISVTICRWGHEPTYFPAKRVISGIYPIWILCFHMIYGETSWITIGKP